VQDFLGREILLENVSSYVEFDGAEMTEWDFLVELARHAGCRILLDVNNIYVSAQNHGFNARDYLAAIPAEFVGEIHLAGHTVADGILIDTHSAPVADAVWTHYRETVQRLGAVPTLIEWDSELPTLDRLLAEARHADETARLAVADGDRVRVA
jgi:uncharacterized protein (UPF0276 family)